MGSLRFLSRTNLGGKPRLFYINLVSEPNPISPFNNQNHDWQPTAKLTIRNNSTARHAITQILTPRDLQTNTTQFLTSRNLQTRARTSPNHIPPLATRILHPKNNRKAYYFPKTCDPNSWSTLRTTTRSETENINSTRKKKKISDPQLQIARLRTRELKAHHQAPIPTNRMTPSHNPPPICRHLRSHHAASRVLRYDSPAPISTFECHWQSLSTSPAISSPSTPKMFRALLCRFFSFSFPLFL